MKKLFMSIMVLFTLTACGIGNVSVGGNDNQSGNDLIDDVSVNMDGIVEVDRFFTYGEHLSIDGKFTSGNEIKDAKIIVGNLSYPLTINEDKTFVIAGKYDERIALYNLKGTKSQVQIYIEANIDGKDQNLQLICTNKDMNDIDFYTILRNGSRNHVNIMKTDNGMFVKVEQVKDLPEDVYDIVIDPGHGGADGGANYKYIKPEKNYSLRSSLYMKEVLEGLGYKVAITREKDILPGNINDPYGPNGRVELVYASKAKYGFSNHLNAAKPGKIGDYNGTEVYSTIHTTPNLARELAAGIVNNGRQYSNNESYMKVEDGVYKRRMLYEEYVAEKKDFDRKGRNYYELIEKVGYKNIDYYFMIRETGGIGTYALRDGRDGKNPNINRNNQTGVENYTIEYAYIDHEDDAVAVDANIEKYVDGLVDAFQKYVNKK